jgi:gas vesicle protein
LSYQNKKMEEKMADNGGSGFFSGLLVGGAIGALAGILFAPKAGKETRDGIMNESDEILGKAKSELEKLRSELGELKDKVTSSMSGKNTTTRPSDIAEERDFEESVSSIDENAPAKKTKKAK